MPVERLVKRAHTQASFHFWIELSNEMNSENIKPKSKTLNVQLEKVS